MAQHTTKKFMTAPSGLQAAVEIAPGPQEGLAVARAEGLLALVVTETTTSEHAQALARQMLTPNERDDVLPMLAEVTKS